MKSIYLKPAIILLFLIISGYGYAQNTVSATDANNNPAVKQNEQLAVKAAPGTYQFIRLSKIEEVFTTDYMNELLIRIENNRQVSEEKYLAVSEYTQVRILSKNIINAPTFIPVEEFISNKIIKDL